VIEIIVRSKYMIFFLLPRREYFYTNACLKNSSDCNRVMIPIIVNINAD